MVYVLADGGLAPWGDAAAIIIALYTFVSIIIGVALAGALMFAFAWIRDKAELIQKIRPILNEVNDSLVAAQKGEPLPEASKDNRIIQAVSQIPKIVNTLPARASNIEQKVEQGSDKVTGVVIEFYARTAMVKGMAKAFFLPGLTRSQVQPASEPLPLQVETEPIATVEEIHEEQPPEKEMIMVQSSR